MGTFGTRISWLSAWLLALGGTLWGQEASGQAADPQTLKFQPPPRVVLKNDLLQTIRGEMTAFSAAGVQVIDDRNRLRQPEGKLHPLSSVESLSVLDANILYSRGEDIEQFVNSLLKSDQLSIVNRAEFVTEEPPPSTTNPDEGQPEGSATGSTSTTTPTGAVVTITCGNCRKDVSLTAQSGQQCPHCGILWDGPPITEEELARLEQMKISQPDASGTGLAMPSLAEAGQPVQNGARPANSGTVPNVAPPPLTAHAPPQPMNLQNLPLWMKVSVFFVCLGAMYYAFFYVR